MPRWMPAFADMTDRGLDACLRRHDEWDTPEFCGSGADIDYMGKKEEASAGSGGNCVSALAGGGNQSLLTV